jgi:shikimate dehydrogenase
VKCAVLGRPIAHSLSPALHLAAYAALGLDWGYERHDVGEEELAGFVERCGPEWRGLSLTMPLKVAAMSLGRPDPVATLVGAANTLVLTDSGRTVHNTDVQGLTDALRRAGVDQLRRVTVVGSGATTRSAIASCASLGTREVAVLARSPERAAPVAAFATGLGLSATVHDFAGPVPAADLLLATVTAGAIGADRAEEFAVAASVVFDAIYDPWPTPLATAAEATGRRVVNGLDLLVGQAVLQIELMTGARVDPAVLYAAGRAALA